MSYQYIKRIPVQQQSADVKNVPCGTAMLPGLVYGEALIGKQFEKINLDLDEKIIANAKEALKNQK